MFRQWVIEDRFRQGRPQWEAVGAQFVTDVAPYEYMKLRLLNASHSAIAALGQLVGYVHVDETMRDDMFQAYMEALMDRETGPTLPLVPGIDLARYKAQLLSRFTNPKIQDTLQRINTDAPINLLLDPIRDILAKGQDCALLTLALAAWMKRCAGIDDRGQSLTIRHPQAELLRARALEGGIDPRPLLTIRSLFGDLVENTGFVENLGRCLATLHQSGTRATMISRLTEPTDTAPLSRRPK
jgi:mannitol-1-phosphate/altronate dehydrogenase